jgi:putative two-component system response regulator
MSRESGSEAARTVLVVDDSPENLAYFGEILSGHFRVRIANSGVRALEAAHLEPIPDLILLDIVMAGMDGYRVFEALKASPTTREVPVIFVTGHEKLYGELRGLGVGAADYLTKPVDPQRALARINAALALRPLTRAANGR